MVPPLICTICDLWLKTSDPEVSQVTRTVGFAREPQNTFCPTKRDLLGDYFLSMDCLVNQGLIST